MVFGGVCGDVGLVIFCGNFFNCLENLVRFIK